MIVLVATVQLPVASHCSPVTTSPTAIDNASVLVAGNLFVLVGPEPARCLVVVVVPPLVPIRAHAAPFALVVAPESAVSVQMHSDSFVTTPGPASLTVMGVIVFIAPVQTPVFPNSHPSSTCPALEAAQAVKMATNSFETTPEPFSRFVVVVLAPQTPDRANPAPAALVVAPELPTAVPVHTNAAVLVSPTPLPLAMVPVIVVVFTIQVPISSDLDPLCTSPALQCAQAVQMTPNTFGPAPEPTSRSVIVVVFPLLP